MATPYRPDGNGPPTGPINVNPWVQTEQIRAQQQLSTDPRMRRPPQYDTGPIPLQSPPEPEPRPRRRHAAEPEEVEDDHSPGLLGSIGWPHVILAIVVGVVLVCVVIALAGDPIGAGALAFYSVTVGGVFGIVHSLVSVATRKKR